MGDELLLEELRNGKNSIIEKVHIDRYINKEVLWSTMVEAWRTTKLFSIREISIKEIQVNSFIISFHNHTNMENVLSRKPWLFDSYLQSLKPFDGITPPQKMKILT